MFKVKLQARNQLGTPGGEKSFRRVAQKCLNYVQYFQTMSNVFFHGSEKFSRGVSPLCSCGYGPVKLSLFPILFLPTQISQVRPFNHPALNFVILNLQIYK